MSNIDEVIEVKRSKPSCALPGECWCSYKLLLHSPISGYFRGTVKQTREHARSMLSKHLGRENVSFDKWGRLQIGKKVGAGKAHSTARIFS